MRILLVNDFAFPLGGAEAHVDALQRELNVAGHETELRTSARAGAISQITRWFDPTAYLRTQRMLHEFRPDVVHVHNWSRALSPSPLIAASRMRIPTVMTVHDAHLVCPKTWMLDERGTACTRDVGFRCVTSACVAERAGRRAMPYHGAKLAKVSLHRAMLRGRVHTFISPSRWLAGRIARDFDVPVAHLPNFSLRRPAAEPPSPAGPPRLLFAGRLVREKGADILIDALAHLPSTITADIAGDGPVRPALVEQAMRLGVHDRVRFHGMLAPEELADLYTRAFAFVAPSRWMENCPLTVVDAIAMGVPVIGARRAGISELVLDAKIGALHTPEDPQDLAAAIGHLLSSPERVRAMRTDALAHARRIYTPAAYVGRLSGVYAAAAQRQDQGRQAPSVVARETPR